MMSLRLPVRAPFHLQATVRLLQRRPSNLVDVWGGDSYLRALETSGGLVLAEVRNVGSVREPEVILGVRGGGGSASRLEELAPKLRRMLGLDVDPALWLRRARAEPAIAGLVEALAGIRPPRFATLFESFLNVIPFQQLSIESGLSTVSRLVRRFGLPLESGGRVFYASPRPEAILAAEPEELRACGLSTKKALALRNVARAVLEGELDEDGLAALPTPEAMKRLVRLPGIGPWSAGLVLLRGLGRLDAFPAGDVGVARGLGELFRLKEGEPMEPIVERFGALRGYLSCLSLGAYLVSRGRVQADPTSR